MVEVTVYMVFPFLKDYSRTGYMFWDNLVNTGWLFLGRAYHVNTYD